MKIDPNSLAFPLKDGVGTPGMSIRTYVAAAIAPGYLTMLTAFAERPPHPETFAQDVLKFTDALIQGLNAGGGDV